MTFQKLEVIEIIKETEDCVSVSFQIPANLRADFDYIPGQYLVLESSINNELVRRSYSLCSAPHQDKWTVAIKKVEKGKFSTWANNDLKVGDHISVMPPSGSFVLNANKSNNKNYVAFVAGSGITPVISMVKSVMHNEPNSSFVLFYGNKTSDSIIFDNELEMLLKEYGDRLSVYSILSQENTSNPDFNGRIDKSKTKIFGTKIYKPNDIDSYFLCGPSQMIFDVKDELISQGVNVDKIHFELFNTDDIKPKEATKDDQNILSIVTVILDDEEFNIPLSSDGFNILDAALDEGADLPYACKGGVCSTCKAKVTEGKVKMDLNYSLDPDEVENGFILTCQSHPQSAKVVVNFDEAY
ncbi:MAG: 2Fe-2S iron-sulfur cluster-binding protein [Saprospiraceae bacterium]